MSLLLFILLLREATAELPTATKYADPSITCFQEDLKCEMVNDNLIATYIGITWQECSLLCEDEIACETFNFFGENSDFHPHNACLLFSECENKIASEDCLLGTREPDCDCTSVKHCPCTTIGYEGVTDSDNFVDLASEVQSLNDCKRLCLNTTDCTILTYYDDQHPVQPEVCLLLKNAGFEKGITKCDHCKTGPASCRSGQKCQAAFLTDGTTNGLVFARTNLTATLVSAEEDCFLELRALAIGGGGGYDGSEHYGGGGSGYPEVGLLQLRANETLNLIVGGAKQTSSVEKEGQVILIAAAGQDNNGNNGGDGYSGGGAGNDGGYDGGDGESNGNSDGGKGSGIDVSTLNMTRFVLTPGKAGLAYNDAYGGGGGGILVNGEEPSGGSGFEAEGFGGGGSRGYYGTGRPGCVLIEV